MSERIEGPLQKNKFGRWEFSEIELTSGDFVDICIEDHWICGVIEYWHDDYYWFSRKDGVPVLMYSGIMARVPDLSDGRYTKK